MQQTDLFTGEPSEPEEPSRVREGHALSMVMPVNALRRAIRDNTFKNRFDRLAGSGVGGNDQYYENLRRRAEEKLFDIPPDAPGHERPVYGFMRKVVDGHMPDTSNVEQYGSALVDLRAPHKSKSVTTTVGDSMDEWVDMPEQLSGHHSAVNPNDELNLPDYREVQFHDRPEPRKDIEHVHLAGEPYYYLARQMHKALDWSTSADVTDTVTSKYNNLINQNRAHQRNEMRDIRRAGYQGPISTWEHKFNLQGDLFSDRPELQSEWVNTNEHGEMEPMYHTKDEQ